MGSGWNKSLSERFAIQWMPEPNSGCWLWIGGATPRGYGRIVVNRRDCQAHRVSWELHRAAIPPGKHVLHKCDNTSCVNPAHLYVGTHQDNMRDAMARGRLTGAKRKTFCLRGHPFSGANLRITNGQRYCLACEALKVLRRTARQQLAKQIVRMST